MSKRCAVKDCPTANPAEIKKRKLCGERPVSSFKVPQKAHRAKEWSAAIGAKSPLTAQDFVCQLHFRHEDVITHFEQQMPDGTMFRKERERYMLRKGASPIGATIVTEEELIILTSSTTEHAYCALKYNDDGKNTGIVEDKRRPDIDNNESHADGDTGSVDKNVDTMPTYSIQLLKNDLKLSQWRPNWIWSSNVDGIIFVHFSHSTMQRRIETLISNDLSIRISFPDKSHDLELEERVRDFQDVTGMLDALESLEVCSGTGHEEQKRSPDCARFLEEDELYAKNRGLQRCVPCRQLRHRLQKKANKPKVPEKVKKSVMNKKLELLQKCHKTLRKKVL